ncbi:MAG: CinA family nicotinamide mononucleotide deamidase-related protein, partial [Oscillospiraceae bacterium]
EKIKKYFETTCRPYTDNNEKQAYIPQKGGKFVNDNGTAPSVYFVDGDTTAILLPGPPKELVPLFETKIKPFLAKFQKGVLHSINLNVFGIGESALECKVKDFLNRQNPTSALYAKNGEVRLRVTALGENETAAEKMCIPTVNEIKAIIGDNIYGTNDDTLESVVVALLLKHHKTLATAESCTGGMLSQRITAISGSSEVFGCGICTYQNKFKEKLLNVSGKTLEEFDAVSKETATEMANGVKKLADSDLGVSITGFAGPTGGNKKDPVGTVYICVSHDGKNDIRRIQAAGRGRNHVRHMACQHALDMIRRILSDIPLD